MGAGAGGRGGGWRWVLPAPARGVEDAEEESGWCEDGDVMGGGGGGGGAGEADAGSLAARTHRDLGIASCEEGRGGTRKRTEDDGERETTRRASLLYSGGSGASRLAVVGSDTAVIDLACPFRWSVFEF